MTTGIMQIKNDKSFIITLLQLKRKEFYRAENACGRESSGELGASKHKLHMYNENLEATAW